MGVGSNRGLRTSAGGAPGREAGEQRAHECEMGPAVPSRLHLPSRDTGPSGPSATVAIRGLMSQVYLQPSRRAPPDQIRWRQPGGGGGHTSLSTGIFETTFETREHPEQNGCSLTSESSVLSRGHLLSRPLTIRQCGHMVNTGIAGTCGSVPRGEVAEASGKTPSAHGQLGD